MKHTSINYDDYEKKSADNLTSDEEGAAKIIFTLSNFSKNFQKIPGFQHCTSEQAEAIFKSIRHFFAVYASGDRSHVQWNESKQVVRAFPHTYAKVMGLTAPQRSWLPKLI